MENCSAATPSRRIRYINAQGNTVRAEEWALLYNGQWAQTSGETYSYDSQNRRTGTLKNNGRQSSRNLTCTGQPLSEVDENGIQTDYAYDAARRLVETTRAEVRDGEQLITPETITEYTRDAAGRLLCTKVHTGAMLSQHSTSYDSTGRVVSETAPYGATTTYSYSGNGRTTTLTQPNGATRITTRHADGSILEASGSGQAARQYSYSLENNLLCTRTLLGDGQTILSEEHHNGFGELVLSKRAVSRGFVCTRYRYNAKGQLVEQQQDSGLSATDGSPLNALAPTRYQYDSFGNRVREILVLTASAEEEGQEEETPNASNSRLTIHTYSKLQESDGGIYSMVTTTHNNSQGGAYNSSRAQLISELSPTLESKIIETDPRGHITTSWVEYGSGAIRLHKLQLPTSSTLATARVVDGFTTSQTDSSGITTSQSRSYGSASMTITQTDGRGNTTATHYDLLGRINGVMDATGASSHASYGVEDGLLAFTVDAQRNETYYRYDLRGNKIAQWGSATQPATFGYDAEGRLTRLTTYRVKRGDISSDPTGRTDGDSTHWTYDPAPGLELSKTYADGSDIVKDYDALGRLIWERGARGSAYAKRYTYHSTTGELTGMFYSAATVPAQAYTYTLTGKLASVTEAAGTHCYSYNEYDELVSDCLTADGNTHLITERRDAFGRSSGYSYSKNGSLVSEEQYSYGADGRLSTAAFKHDDTWKSFEYGYLPGCKLLQSLSMPNGVTLMQEYENQRDMLTGMSYMRGETTTVAERSYSYDTLERPISRTEEREGATTILRSDTFTHNSRGELTGATLGNATYSYAYDNIGNRKSAQENSAAATAYTTNALNQYTSMGSFWPTYDADGNQTQVQTSSGIWNVTYNTENRPITFSRNNSDGSTTRITCTYDYMGRRATKRVDLLGGTVPIEEPQIQRYIYRGYLQVACCDMVASGTPCLWVITWDPTQPVATRPLAIRKDNIWYTYGWDLTKNVCEVFSTEGTLATTYNYTPYGEITAEGAVQQPLQWSSEFYDEELGLVYYNYRHYNPIDGRWSSRDPQDEKALLQLYSYVENSTMKNTDVLGKDRYINRFDPLGWTGESVAHVSVAVDVWKIVDCKYKHVSIKRFDFSPSYYGGNTYAWYEDLLEYLNTLAGFVVSKGRVISERGLSFPEPVMRKTSPCQDIAMLQKMIEDKNNPALYSLIFNNCIDWANRAFEYGMEQPGLGQCLNPDNTIFE